MDITKAQFWNTPNVAGLSSFSYAELLAQLVADLPGGNSPNLGIGCHASGTGSVAGGGRVPIPFDTALYDDANFLDIGGANPERMTIPVLDPPIERIVVGGFLRWAASTSGNERRLIFTKNFNEITDGSSDLRVQMPVPGPGNQMLAMSPPQNVIAGDWFEVQGLISGGVAPAVNVDSAGWIIVIR